MKQIGMIGGKLAIICAVAAIALGIVNAVTKPIIQKRAEERLARALEFTALGGNVGERRDIEEAENKTVTAFYPVESVEGAGKAYLIRLIGIGYGGEMQLLALYDQNGKLLNAKLMQNNETPGLGKEAEEAEYMGKYIGHGNDSPIPVRKDQLEKPEAVSGATITFIGVGKALKAGSEFVKSGGVD